MKNEFEKLDTFMRQHRPSPAASPTPRLPEARRPWWLLGSAAAACAVVVLLSVRHHQAQMNEEAIALAETLEWEISPDDLSQDVSDMVAIAEN